MSRPLPCQSDPDTWFKREHAPRAAALCGGCPVKMACRERGWETTHGVWGGLTPPMRQKLNPERFAAARVRETEEQAQRDRAIKVNRMNQMIQGGSTHEEVAKSLGVKKAAIDRAMYRARERGLIQSAA